MPISHVNIQNVKIKRLCRSSHSIVRYGSVYTLRLIGHTHDRERPIQNFSPAPLKLGADISRPVWTPKPTEFGSFLVSFHCAAFTAIVGMAYHSQNVNRAIKIFISTTMGLKYPLKKFDSQWALGINLIPYLVKIAIYGTLHFFRCLAT